MNFANNHYEEKNLPDELLSEGVSFCKVRDSDRILHNIMRKSLIRKNTTVELSFSFRPCEVSCLLSKTTVKKNEKKFRQSKKIISCYQVEDLSKYSKGITIQSGNDELKTGNTLKSDISCLLRLAAQLRMKDQCFSPSLNLCTPRKSKNLDDSYFVTMKDIGTFKERRTK